MSQAGTEKQLSVGQIKKNVTAAPTIYFIQPMNPLGFQVNSQKLNTTSNTCTD